eukprot:GHVS01071384.1.p1 GENE.GHVS01071384.1~~GHVS01071384.1.p1  ORF type:complete len:337 (-),score=26.79 GHVS01071384.1:192-1202(-)
MVFTRGLSHLYDQPLMEMSEETLKNFTDFDWSDSRWQAYLSGLYPVPPADKIQKWKKKWYKKNVDSSFDSAWEPSPQRSSPSPTVGGIDFGAQRSNPPHLSLLKSTASISFLTAVFLSTLYTLPLLGTAPKLYVGAMICYFMGLICDLGSKYGRPQWSMSWWQPLFLEDSGQMIMYMFFTVLIIRNPLSFIPLAITSAIHTAETYVQYKQQLPAVLKNNQSLDSMATSLHSQRMRWMQLRADAEVGLGVMLILLAFFTGGSGLLASFLYFHFMKIRYSMSGFTSTTFRKIDAKLTSLTNSSYCPGVLRYVYSKVRSLASSLAAPPTAGGGRACTIQ